MVGAEKAEFSFHEPTLAELEERLALNERARRVVEFLLEGVDPQSANYSEIREAVLRDVDFLHGI